MRKRKPVLCLVCGVRYSHSTNHKRTFLHRGNDPRTPESEAYALFLKHLRMPYASLTEGRHVARYRAKRAEKGQCIFCPRPTFNDGMCCEMHTLLRRERARERQRAQKR